jgi:5,6-dimethylbenzimidazole synthase
MNEVPESSQSRSDFSEEERNGVYRAVFERRDVRSQFLPIEVPEPVLGRILVAAHHAPSVGFMQPWEFTLIRSREVRQKVHESFQRANSHEASLYQDERQILYQSLRLQGILSSPLNICVTCNRQIQRGYGLGRHSIPEMDLYSCVCAVQNLWLAARAEGVGIGWVSILSNDDLREILCLPDEVEPIAYLCVGYVSEFARRPDLEVAGWAEREQLAKMLYFDRYGAHDLEKGRDLVQFGYRTFPDKLR